MKILFVCVLALSALLTAAGPAAAECNCLAVAAEVPDGLRARVARADNLYARGDYDEALALYIEAYASGRHAVLLYAQAMCQWQLGATADARATFGDYLAAGGELGYRARAEAALAAIDAGTGRPIAGAVDAATGTVVGAVGTLRGRRDDDLGAAAGVVGGAAGVGAGVVGGLDATVAKPKKVAKGAAIVLGVVAVAAIATVGVQGIRAGFSDDIDFDKNFGLGVGLSGAVMGGTAIYLWGLTTTAGAASSLPCVGDGAPVITPVAYPSGGGVAAAMAF